MNLKVILIFLTSLFLSMHVEAKRLTVAFGEAKPPYVYGNTRTGLEVDLFRAAAADLDKTLIPLIVPNNRLIRALDTMADLDAASNVFGGSEKYYEVKDFIVYEDVAISRKDDNLKIDNISDLKNYTVVAFQNAHLALGDEYHKLFSALQEPVDDARYFELPNQEQQNRLFWMKRVDVIVLDRFIFNFFRNQLSAELDTTQAVRIHNLFPKKTHSSVLFRDPEQGKIFEKGLSEIKASGLYDLLFENYLKKEERRQELEQVLKRIGN